MRVANLIGLVILTLGLTYAAVLAQIRDNAPALESVRMIDTLTGWAVTDESGAERLLHTSDGGRHWLDVSPLNPAKGQIVDYHVTALSSLLAWVASSELPTGTPTGTTRIFRTNDGGRRWGSAAIHATSTLSIHFINTRDGWLLSNERAAAGSMEVNIYRSTDGGGTWIKVESTRFNDESSGLPFVGDKAGLTFLNTMRGWVTGAILTDDSIYLYITNDGGRTWGQQNLPLPHQLTPHWNDWTMPPTFFTARDGILPVFYAIRNELHRDIKAVLVCYATHDAGTNWTYTTPVPIGLGKEFSTSFADINHGWVTDGAALYATIDGGRQWTTIRSPSFLVNVKQLDFISPSVGWAVSRTPPSLLKTMDGGVTWTPVAYTVWHQ